MDEKDSSTVFLDVILLALAGFVCLVILLLPHINAPTPVTTDGPTATESVIFEISWPPETDADVDLWVRAPGDIAVGYSNKGGLFCNLLRDDLGRLADPLQINHEETVCRGIVTQGRYTVNIHAFRGDNVTWPIPVRMVVRTKKGSFPMNDLVQGTQTLNFVGEEVTMANFILNEDALLEAGTLDTVRTPLRAYSGK